MIVYVVERSPNGTSKRIPATTLFSYLEQANVKVQLTQIGVVMSVARTELSPAQLKQLLQNAPAGKRVHARFVPSSAELQIVFSWVFCACDLLLRLLSFFTQVWTPLFGSRLRWTTLTQRSMLLKNICLTSNILP